MTKEAKNPYAAVRKAIGDSTESKVKRAVDYLLEEGELDTVEQSDDLDQKGVDLLVGKGNKKYKLSIKTSERGMDLERKKHPERYRNGDKIFIIPQEEETKELLGKRIISTIAEFEEQMHQK